jgi:LPXTG-site transpeptidase (sortase) family protein
MMTDKPGAAWRKILLPLGALLLSGMLLFTGLSVLKTQAADRTTPQEVGHNAPLQQPFGYDFALTAEVRPNGEFQVGGSNNRYIITVNGQPLPTGTIPSVLNVFAQLPDGITWTPANSGRWACFSVTNQIDCDYRGPVTTTIDTLTVNVNVSPDIQPTVSTLIELSVADDNAGNNNVSLTIPINSADLELTKDVIPITADVGSIITYTLAITNNGPNTVNSFIVEDLDLPDTSLIFNGQIPNDGSYNPANGRWSYTPAVPLPVDGEVRKTLVYLVGAGTSGQINNTARIISSLGPSGQSRGDWITTNNSDSASVVIGGLTINKTVTTPNGSTEPITATVGQPIDVTIRVTNPTSIEITDGITVTEEIPTGLNLRFPLPSGSRWDPTTRIYTYRRSTLAPATEFNFTITLLGDASINFQEEFTNVATVSWGSPRNTVESNEVTFTVYPGGALYVTKNDNLSQVYTGDAYSYTIAITNTGNVQVNQVVLTDTLGSQLSATGLNLGSVATGSCPNSGYCRITLTNPLTAGQKVTFRVGARVAVNAVPGSNVENTILAVGRDADSDARVTSTATDTNVVLESPATQVRIAKDVNPIQGGVGETLTFRIEVRNTGNTAVNNVRVLDEFVTILDLVSATTTRGTATLNTGARTLDVLISTLNPSERASIVVTTRVNSTVTVTKVYRNNATVTWTPGGKEVTSNTVAFRALPSSALPGTGLNPPFIGFVGPPAVDPAQGAAGSFVSGLLGLLAVGLGLLAIGLLGYSLWARANRPLYAGRIARGGLALVLAALVCGVGAMLLQPSQTPPTQLASLAGEKPPLATSAPTQPSSPTRTPKLPGPAQEEPVEAAVPVIETRPTEAIAAPTLEPLPAELAHLAPTPTPSFLPDYPIPTPTAMPAAGPDGGAPDPSAVTRIVIPAINLDAVVKYVPYSGYTWLIGGLKQEVAWMGDTSWPGLGGNTGLAGHVDLVDGSPGPFWNLNQLKPGDQVMIHTQQKVYTYRVSGQRVVEDTDTSVLAPTDKPQITLITCTDWSSELRTYLQRLIVFAEFVQVQAQ